MPVEYNHASADNPTGLVAIIDIGSNSVRMVVYHALKRVPLPLFNEKYMCALGKGLARTGRLNPAGVEEAYGAIARFMVMARRLEVASLDILATAAVRDASNGKEFVAKLERDHKLEVTVISGELEAQLAAQGILASVHEPLGISADLGGGSMELATVERTRIGYKSSCHLGSLRLLDSTDNNLAKMEKLITQELAQVTWLKKDRPSCIYAIGGGFRALAKLHQRKTAYPLDIVHEYVMSRRSVNQLIEKLLEMKPDQIADLPGVSARRAPTLIPTAMVMQQLLDHTGAPQVMFSVSGIREGFFYGLLDERKKKEDALLASATDLAALIGRAGGYAKELNAWMAPLFPNEPLLWNRLRHALCILSELAWAIDPNFRAIWAYHRIIQSSLKGMDHKERIMLAMALFHRYQAKWKNEHPALKLLDERERQWARCVGLAAGLAFQLSGGKVGNLHHAKLSWHDGQVRLALDSEATPLRTEQVDKRVTALSDALRHFSLVVAA